MLKAAKAYFQTQVSTTSQGDLLLLLYDGGIKFLKQAKVKIEEKDYAAKGILISKAIDVISELDSSLNSQKGGELAQNLHNLYFFCNTRLLKANMNMDTQLIDDVIKILLGLRDAFAQILPGGAQAQSSPGMSPPAPAAPMQSTKSAGVNVAMQNQAGVQPQQAGVQPQQAGVQPQQAAPAPQAGKAPVAPAIPAAPSAPAAQTAQPYVPPQRPLQAPASQGVAKSAYAQQKAQPQPQPLAQPQSVQAKAVPAPAQKTAQVSVQPTAQAPLQVQAPAAPPPAAQPEDDVAPKPLLGKSRLLAGSSVYRKMASQS